MPQLQNLTVNDRQTTPVAHLFVPRDIQGNVGYVTESSGVPLGDSRIAIGMAKTSSGNYKGTLRMTLPVVQTQTINGISTPVVVRTSYLNLEVTFAPSSTEAERNNAIGMLADSLGVGKTLVNDTLVKLQGVY